jgi:chromosome segregation ATPase
MVTFEQIKLLESKITRVIDVVIRLGEENDRLKKQNGELEELVEKLKSEKSRIEEGIVSALDRLNQFEDTIERSLDSVKNAKAQDKGPSPQQSQSGSIQGRVPDPGTDPVRPVQTERPAQIERPVQTGRPIQAEPVRDQSLPQTYLVEEEEENEDTGEAELDIF